MKQGIQSVMRGVLLLAIAFSGIAAAEASERWTVIDRPFGPDGGKMAVSPRDNISGAQVRYYCMPSSAGAVERIGVHNPNIGRLETNKPYTVNFAFPDTGDQMLTVPMLARPLAEMIESDGSVRQLLDIMGMQSAMAVTQDETVRGYPVSLDGFADAKRRVRTSCGLR